MKYVKNADMLQSCNCILLGGQFNIRFNRQLYICLFLEPSMNKASTSTRT